MEYSVHGAENTTITGKVFLTYCHVTAVMYYTPLVLYLHVHVYINMKSSGTCKFKIIYKPEKTFRWLTFLYNSDS